MGTTLNYIINEIAGGVKNGRQLKGVQLGGPSGCLVPAQLMDTPVCFESLKEKGLVMGAGGILVLDEEVCVVNLARYFMDFADKQSCGKCIPCREGTKRMSEILASICRKQADEEGHSTLERFKGVMQLESLAGVMKDTSLCGLGRDASNPVLSSLKYFRSEYEEHIFNRNCPSNTCTELRTYYIDVDFCTGCAICAKRCPAEAIIGTKKHPYFIVQEKCIGCGICMEVCKFSAVFYK
jgi:NADH:ubiquinone oxidoreductase subunit F (NADH-binding)/Pyruvate/2-oxoacid:ferredoxin oxidoreductase delta subunit